jgi:hypothetical protein
LEKFLVTSNDFERDQQITTKKDHYKERSQSSQPTKNNDTLPNKKLKMADEDEDIAALVVDNGSGMCKGTLDIIFSVFQVVEQWRGRRGQVWPSISTVTDGALTPFAPVISNTTMCSE